MDQWMWRDQLHSICVTTCIHLDWPRSKRSRGIFENFDVALPTKDGKRFWSKKANHNCSELYNNLDYHYVIGLDGDIGIFQTTSHLVDQQRCLYFFVQGREVLVRYTAWIWLYNVTSAFLSPLLLTMKNCCSKLSQSCWLARWSTLARLPLQLETWTTHTWEMLCECKANFSPPVISFYSQTSDRFSPSS